MSKSRIGGWLAGAMVLLCFEARAATITFDTVPIQYGFTGPVTEDGFTYSVLSGPFNIVAGGNPGNAIMGDYFSGLNVLDVTSAVPSRLFSFTSIDLGAFAGFAGTQTTYIAGVRAGALAGLETYTLANTNSYTTEDAVNLAGVPIDDLQIQLPAGYASGSPPFYPYDVLADNIVLSSVTVPEPTSWMLMVLGICVVGGVMRKRPNRAGRGARYSGYLEASAESRPHAPRPDLYRAPHYPRPLSNASAL